MDPSLLHRVPDENVIRAPVEYVIACCERCESPLCIDAPPPDMVNFECGAFGKKDPAPLLKMLKLQSGQMYDFQRIEIDQPQEDVQQGADDSSDAATEKAQEEEIPVDATIGAADAPSASAADVPGTPLAPAADVPHEPLSKKSKGIQFCA
eukprot:12181290-Karenia_brevis.AAC.1